MNSNYNFNYIKDFNNLKKINKFNNVIIDFSHLSFRMLYTAIWQSKPKKKDGLFITEDFIQMYYHLMLQNINYIKKEFGAQEIIIAIDSKNNWRKDIYPKYKAGRKEVRDKSEINFEEFFNYLNGFIDELKNHFKMKVIGVDKAEADDVILVLSEKFKEDLLVITEDKDMKIVLQNGSSMYMPIKKEMVNLSKEELTEWIKVHICIGDKVDNIPNIKWNLKFTDEFKKYLKDNNYSYNELEYTKLTFDERDKIEENFDVWKLNKKGEKVEKLIYKEQRFGEKTAQKFVKNLKEELKDEHLRLNFAFNKTLIHPSGIPAEIKNNIIEEYEKTSSSFNPDGIMNFLIKNNLREHLRNVTKFYI